MKHIGFAVAFTALLLAPVGTRATIRWFPVGTNQWFADVHAQLQVLVDKNGRRETNRLCVVGEEADGVLQAYVYWPEESKLILWVPDRYDSQAIVHSRRYLDLKRDVVEGDDVHGSTYLLTRATANSKIRACQRFGTTYRLERRAGSGTHG